VTVGIFGIGSTEVGLGNSCLKAGDDVLQEKCLPKFDAL